ncbi:SDR family oxidoreductase [Burkholderia pseudomultivorans]|uniref:Short-chain type dehydrogenase/reductase n=1 Tax=Burkholderia pseudomultivorans TaxID=1207504 RepID=A0ABU2E930_9BURK|nr:SDR family oxidoreductase [Burkholderia pseudomultivorans]MDR8726306.1 putative short-chain type dehydrogenase/reductase [Burkholderia pseudomultivorans]MDR8733530.1 putative short-chain type dehydrogenase/reductase [Burkholderia pseudomultivorans]MDR8740056.1 putative short-chain type dehydrogenase/reductase [Burkholderia pseudomultivorans]MDR8756181.1 putative short-chain type dehydrogenase/reductase [Burkholderia pseudomultivorans]MDR8776671.1 putative short-chain type dehydrogenase/redu
MGICNGRTVIITGAGGGLGREYALAFAAEGAAVVVNDIRHDAAQAVCDEIAERSGSGGGRALANADDITRVNTAQRIVDAAREAFGDVHVLVNNAGICRDKMFASMTEADWDDVMRVHLRGHFCLSNVLARVWRDAAKAGAPVDARIVNTSSGAGLQGSIGQSNYGAAKAGIAALTLMQAVELQRYGVRVNALAPAARTSMTEGVFAEMMKKPEDGGFDYFDPANVAPLVVWLGSPLSADVTGQLFEVAGGMIAVAEGWRTGPSVDRGARWAPAEIGPAISRLLADARPAQRVYGS